MHSNVRFMLRKSDATMLSCSGGIAVLCGRFAPDSRFASSRGTKQSSLAVPHHKSFETNQLINPIINQFNSL